FDPKIISSYIEKNKISNHIFYPEQNVELINYLRDYQSQKREVIVHPSNKSDSNQTLSNKIYKETNFNIQFDNSNEAFSICGDLDFNIECKSKYSNVFAVIYNYLIRNSSIETQEDLPAILNNNSKFSKTNIDVRENYKII